MNTARYTLGLLSPVGTESDTVGNVMQRYLKLLTQIQYGVNIAGLLPHLLWDICVLLQTVRLGLSQLRNPSIMGKAACKDMCNHSTGEQLDEEMCQKARTIAVFSHDQHSLEALN